MTGDRIRWTPEMDRRLIELFDEGLRLSDVAYWMGLRPKQVVSRRQKIGVVRTEETEDQLRKADAAFVRALAEAYQRGEFPRATYG